MKETIRAKYINYLAYIPLSILVFKKQAIMEKRGAGIEFLTKKIQ